MPQAPIPERVVIEVLRPFQVGDVQFEAFPLEHSIRAPAVCSGGSHSEDLKHVIRSKHP